MVGDYFSKMATAQKMTPQQLNQSVKDGVLTPDMAQNAQQTSAPQMGIQGLQQPPIAQEVMQQADQMMAPEQIEHKINELKTVVAQVHQGVQSGEIEAYKGIPFIKEQLEKIQMLEAQLPKQGIDTAIPESQIEQQVAQAPQQAPQGIDVAPSNLPTQMAEGGIIGFAVGGMDDDEEDRELEQLYGSGTDNDFIQSIMASSGQRSIHPSAAVQMEPMSEVSRKGKHKYEDLVIKEAQRQGLPPEIAVHALYKETGNHPNPETAMSKAGAYGPMQLMAGTAKQMGVDRMDPIQNIQGGIGYLKQQYDKYQDPTLTLMAYNAGPGRVDRALKSEKGIAALPAETRHYVNMAEGGIAHFVNDGKVSEKDYDTSSQLEDQSMGDSGADNEYLQRSRGLVQGVKNIGTALTTPRNYDLYDLYQRNIGQPFAAGVNRFVNESKEDQAARFNAASNARKNVSFTDTSAPKATEDAPNFGVINPSFDDDKPVAAKAKPSSMSISSPDQVGPQYSLGNPPSAAPAENAGIKSAPAVTSPTSDPIAQLMTEIASQRAESKKNAETNKYLALMQAGFGMMGGTSPYAAVNIGQGAEKGVGTYAALNAATQKEQSDLMNQQLGLYKYQSSAEIGRKRNELTERALGEKPTLIENLQVKADTALNRNPQYISLSKGLEKEREAGTLTPEKEQRYLNNMEMITKNTYSNFGVPYKPSTVKLPPIETPPPPKPKGFFEGMFGGSSAPTAPTISADQQALLDKYK